MNRGAKQPGGRLGGRPSDVVFAPVALRSAHPPLVRWVAIVAIAVGLAVAKPWAAPDGGVAIAVAGSSTLRAAAGPSAAPVAGAVVPAAASPIGSDSAGPGEDTFCFGNTIWLVAYVESWDDRTLRVLRALEPALAASGPDDARIPTVGIYTPGVTLLGWCAPMVGRDRPTGSAEIVAWRRTATGSASVRLEDSQPLGVASQVAALYDPPTEPGATAAAGGLHLWPAGRYVFRYRETAGPERWFAIEVELHPETAREP